MAIEIERKFLVKGEFCPSTPGVSMTQGYLSASRGVTVRIRRAGEAYFLTIKGKTRGLSRPEYEYEIPASDGAELLALCQGGLIEKVRYAEPVGQHIFEVDVFAGDNAGLVVAEVELRSETESFEAPVWLGAEVSFDSRYTNSALSKLPFSHW